MPYTLLILWLFWTFPCQKSSNIAHLQGTGPGKRKFISPATPLFQVLLLLVSERVLDFSSLQCFFVSRCIYIYQSIKHWMGPYQRTLPRKLLARAIRYSGFLGVRSFVGPTVGSDFLEYTFAVGEFQDCGWTSYVCCIHLDMVFFGDGFCVVDVFFAAPFFPV